MSKAEAFAQNAIDEGWVLDKKESHEDNGATIEKIVITSERLRATMTMVWRNDCYDYKQSGLSVVGHNRTVRNASEGRRFLKEIAPPKTSPIGKSRRTKRRADPVPSVPAQGETYDESEIAYEPAPRPFSDDTPDDDVIKAVLGREVVWESSITNNVLSATVLPSADQKHLRIERHPHNNKRILTFAARGEGFRSVYLSSIIEVN
jgi:hypothetical protein